MIDTSEDLLKKLDKEEDTLASQDDSDAIPPEDIFTYSEPRSCSDIARMISEGNLERDPFYQREDVWHNPEKTRFIDSLLKRMPIPSMCFSVNKKDEYQIIDGRQRTTTIVEFINAINNLKEKGSSTFIFSSLDDVDKRISGKTLDVVLKNNPEVATIVKNASIPINMLKCDYEKDNNMKYIFKIFHRLNSGGVKLTNQEIRNCIYSGPLNNLINELDKNASWEAWVPAVSKNSRGKGRERILTFIALYNSLSKYNGKMTSFLNEFMKTNSSANPKWLEMQKILFEKTIKEAFKIKLKMQKNIYIDAVLYGVAKSIETYPERSWEQLNQRYEELMQCQSFSKENVQEGTAKEEGVKRRLSDAENIFSR